jgi:hypothetical protein
MVGAAGGTYLPVDLRIGTLRARSSAMSECAPRIMRSCNRATDRCVNLAQMQCIERMHNRAKCELSARRLK